ncbi:hypothetical protein [Bifidobacterium porcinum]|uniref:hypothetical protein n=1 Tax=Bifidobacterium porcinum TaxID=212365 RepID=UPI000A896D20|nr:hypothetical protein [Bifidobacterium porcinum]
MTVKKASDGRYYFDAIVPAGLNAGSHTVSLTDAKGTCQGWTPVTVTAASTVTMFRLYNRLTGEHFYTSSSVERDALVKVGWRAEGIGWYLGGSVKVLREYNPYVKTGTHNYTTDAKEKTALVKAGWRAEGVGWYAVKAK